MSTKTAPWSTWERDLLETTSRVGSVFSLMGAGFIIITFLCSKSFHRPINRLAFFAAFGNIATNIATLMAQDPIPFYGESSSVTCKVQGMMIHWFLPADALFCAAMALNVYLTVFKKYTSERLQKLEIPYILFCYGVPLVPAFTFLFIRGADKGDMYGDAVLWCWISSDWQIMRIATFYGPVWIVLLFTFTIYIMAGRVIFSLRDSLRKFAREDPSQTDTLRSRFRDSTITKPPPTAQPESVELSSTTVPILSDASPAGMSATATITTTVSTLTGRPGAGSEPSYSCTIESGTAHLSNYRNRSAVEANTAAWAYCRCAMLFFLALLITWLPSSINRIYGVIDPHASNFGLNFAAALVLPCQGFWNGLIYIVTTLPACKEFFSDIWQILQNPLRAWRKRGTSSHTTQVYTEHWKGDTGKLVGSDEELAHGRLGR